jgi:two-component system KDP operon response regulator KdpE
MSLYPPILVIDDEPETHRTVRPALEAAGFDPLRADTGAGGLRKIARNAPTAVVLDLSLPDMDGKNVVARAREFYAGPIIVLAGRAEQSERISALELGANDYVAKPFDVSELLAKLQGALHLGVDVLPTSPNVVRAGDLVIDFPRRLVLRAGKPIRLSPKEYDLLAQLAKGSGKVMRHSELLPSIWGTAHVQDAANLRVLVGQLRQKVEPNPSEPRVILTEPGIGYRFVCGE